MREFTTTISEALVNGLKPDERVNRSAEILVDAKNVYATKYGLKQLEPLEDPFMGTKKIRFPFPQLFLGESVSLLADDTSLYEVGVSKSPWGFSKISTRGHIKQGGIWHFADMRGNWFLTNGETVVWQEAGEYVVDSSGKFSTTTAHRGRIVVGGFKPGEVWKEEWENVIRAWKSDTNYDMPDSPELGTNYVLWSSIGAGDFPRWILSKEVDFERDVVKGVDKGPFPDDVLDRMKRNEFGFMPMPWQGEVLAVKPLGKSIVVYGTEGVTALYMSGSTYGVNHLLNTGVYDRGSVGVAYGGRDQGGRHVFVDSEGSLWTIGSNLVPEKLGYKEYLSEMFGEDIVISHNQEDDVFLICSQNYGFVLSEQGLTRQSQKVTSQVFAQGNMFGVFRDDFERDVEIVSNYTDLGERGIKTVTFVGLGLLSPKDVEVAIDYRYSVKDEFERSHFVPVNQEGIARMAVSGVDFRVVVSAPDFEEFELDYINLSYQVSDKRFKRGVNVS